MGVEKHAWLVDDEGFLDVTGSRVCCKSGDISFSEIVLTATVDH